MVYDFDAGTPGKADQFIVRGLGILADRRCLVIFIASIRDACLKSAMPLNKLLIRACNSLSGSAQL